jgi:hypothetical protein
MKNYSQSWSSECTNYLFLHLVQHMLQLCTCLNGMSVHDRHCFILIVHTHALPDDLDTRKSTGTSCQIEIHFMIKTTEYLL